MDFFNNLWEVTELLGIWFLLGLLIAALMHGLVPSNFFKKWLGKNSFANVLKAAFIGVPMPLCSCGVVPTVIALKKKGASNSACLSFLISTPQTGVDSLLVSASFLSWPFAIFKLVSAFIIGILGGGVHLFLNKKNDTIQADLSVDTEESSARLNVKELWNFAVNDLFYMLWRWMLVGIVAAALLSTFLSADFLGNSLFADPFYGSLAALFLSIPLYVCATSSVPIAAVLVLKGMHPAVAIVFLIAGPATNIATIGLIYKSFGKLFTGVYLASVSVGSVVCAVFCSSLITIVIPDMEHNHVHVSPLETAGAVVFSLFLLSFLLRDLKTFISAKLSAATESLIIGVDGVTCQGCVNKIRKAILGQGLGEVITGDPEAKTITVTGTQLQRERIEELIVATGFTIIALP